MNKKVFFETVAFLIISSLALAYTVYAHGNTLSKIKVFYYYSPDCPNCKAAKPFIDSLKPELSKKNIRFIDLNIKKPESWNPTYRWLAEKIVATLKTNFLPIPTASVWYRGRFYTFVGKDEVLSMNDFFHQKAGTKLISAKLKEQQFQIEKCLGCHEERKIPPPSTYNCTFCCHREKPKS